MSVALELQVSVTSHLMSPSTTLICLCLYETRDARCTIYIYVPRKVSLHLARRWQSSPHAPLPVLYACSILCSTRGWCVTFWEYTHSVAAGIYSWTERNDHITRMRHASGDGAHCNEFNGLSRPVDLINSLGFDGV